MTRCLTTFRFSQKLLEQFFLNFQIFQTISNAELIERLNVLCLQQYPSANRFQYLSFHVDSLALLRYWWSTGYISLPKWNAIFTGRICMWLVSVHSVWLSRSQSFNIHSYIYCFVYFSHRSGGLTWNASYHHIYMRLMLDYIKSQKWIQHNPIESSQKI